MNLSMAWNLENHPPKINHSKKERRKPDSK